MKRLSCKARQPHDFLLCAEDTVARITETGNDVRVLVEAFVKRTDEYVNVGMLSLNSLNALGRADKSHKADVQAEPPVASMGSTSMTILSSISFGSLQ